MLELIDWPNLLTGTVIGAVFGFLISSLFYSWAKRDSDRKHRELVDKLERLEQQGKLKLEKDRQGNIVGVELKVDPASVSVQGKAPTLRIDAPHDPG